MRTRIFASALFLAAISGATPGLAATIGVAVDGLNSSTTVGTTVDKSGLLDIGSTPATQAIEYFIPLSGSATPCVYGDCGTSADNGYGGQSMSMFLSFSPVSTTNASVLEIMFEDLDLIGASDPSGFLESVEVFNGGGTSLTGGAITNITSAFVSGDASTQQLLALNLGVAPGDPYFVELIFAADSDFYGRNTPEYLFATVRSCEVGVDPGCATGADNPVPLPAALPLFLSALGGFGIFGWVGRRRNDA